MSMTALAERSGYGLDIARTKALHHAPGNVAGGHKQGGEKMKKGYSAVVESGSCSPDYRRWEEREHCGHVHRTIDAARECLGKKQSYTCNHGRPAGSLCCHCHGWARRHQTSATWYNGTIHNQDEQRAR